MSIKNNQSLWSSVILHGALIIALFLSTIIEAFLPKEKPHVFEMVSQSSPSNAAPSPAAPTNTPPNLELPDVPPMDIADPVIPMSCTDSAQASREAAPAAHAGEADART